MQAAINFVSLILRQLDRAFEFVSPVFQLAIRLYVASVFFRSGLTKIQDFSSTVALFESEYQVPFLPPEVAAYLGTGAELLLPVLFVLGLFSRPTAIALFVFNIVAVVSYADISDLGRADHLLWGALILVIVCFGGGRLSADYWWSRRQESRQVG